MNNTCHSTLIDTVFQHVDSTSDIVRAIFEERTTSNQNITNLLIVMIDILQMIMNKIFEDKAVNTDMLEIFIVSNNTLASSQTPEIHGEISQLLPQYIAARANEV